LRTRSRSRTKHRGTLQSRIRPKRPRAPARPGYSRRRTRTAGPSGGDGVASGIAREGHAVSADTPFSDDAQYGASGATALSCASVRECHPSFRGSPGWRRLASQCRGRRRTHPVRFASYDVVRHRSDAEVECFLRAPGS
jgi:hypothetical protein